MKEIDLHHEIKHHLQSHADGRLSDDEYHWLTMRAEGGFGLTMTCASHVQAIGKRFPGQLGCFSDDHLDGLSRLATGIKAEQSLALVQLHHAGMRSPKEEIHGAHGYILCQFLSPIINQRTDQYGGSLDNRARIIFDIIEGIRSRCRPDFEPVTIPVTRDYLRSQGLGEPFVEYMSGWGGFVEDQAPVA